jgi:hypothetical protein
MPATAKASKAAAWDSASPAGLPTPTEEQLRSPLSPKASPTPLSGCRSAQAKLSLKHKPQAWKKRKYFSAAGKAGVFSVKVHRATGESRVLKLYSMASTKIERHIQVRGAANPYDSRYTEYFAQRRCFAWRMLGGGPHGPVASNLSG